MHVIAGDSEDMKFLVLREAGGFRVQDLVKNTGLSEQFYDPPSSVSELPGRET